MSVQAFAPEAARSTRLHHGGVFSQFQQQITYHPAIPDQSISSDSIQFDTLQPEPSTIPRKTALYASGGKKILQSLGCDAAGAALLLTAGAAGANLAGISLALGGVALALIGSGMMIWGMVNLGRGLFAGK